MIVRICFLLNIKGAALRQLLLLCSIQLLIPGSASGFSAAGIAGITGTAAGITGVAGVS